MTSQKVLTQAEARSQLWKAVSDNKAVHVDNLLNAYPTLSSGEKPKEALPEDGSEAFGWYGRVLCHIPLLSRPEDTAAQQKRALDTLEVLKKHQVPFEGVSEFADSVVTRKLLAHPSSPYGKWFLDQGLLSHQQVLEVAFGTTEALTRRPGPRP